MESHPIKRRIVAMEAKEIRRIEPVDARERVISGKALLVCGYEGQEKFKTFRLERAIALENFISKLPSLDRSQEIIFYCA